MTIRYISPCRFRLGLSRWGNLRRLYLGWLMIEYRKVDPRDGMYSEEEAIRRLSL